MSAKVLGMIVRKGSIGCATATPCGTVLRALHSLAFAGCANPCGCELDRMWGRLHNLKSAQGLKRLACLLAPI